LHQYCRCIEGLILPDPGNTKKQFRSRTELFIGPKHHVLMGELDAFASSALLIKPRALRLADATGRAEPPTFEVFEPSSAKLSELRFLI
jgi:hypothetical protein